MAKRSLLLVLASCAASLAIAAQAASPLSIDLSPKAERMPVWKALRVVAGADPRLQAFQIAKIAEGGDALSLDSPDRVLGRGTKPYWAMFSLYNPGALAEMRMLAMEATTQSDAELYARVGSAPWSRLGSLADASSGRLGGGTRYPVWALQLAPQQTTELLLRVEGPAIVRFPVFLYHPARFAETEGRTHIAIGLALGGCLFVIVFVGWRRQYLDDRSVSLFICMIVADLLGALWVTGTLNEFFPAMPYGALSAIGFASYALLFGCGILHARIYLNLDAWASATSRLLQLLAWFWILLAPWFPLAFPVAARIVIVWGGTGVALTLVAVSLIATHRKIPLSGFIASAWLVYLLVGSYFLGARAIDNPILWSPNTAALVQVTLVAVLFGFAMNQRLTQQRDLLMAAHQEAVRRQESIATLMRERGLLFAATNHDLRQPLLGIALFAALLKSAGNDSERREYAHKLDLALKEVDDLAMSIQQLAAANEASTRPVLDTVKLDDLLKPVIEEYRARSKFKRIAIRYAPSGLSIRTHVPYFQRIVRNVLSNAIRYTDRGGRILVGCRRGGDLRLLVADTGTGLSEEQMKHAFEAFERFDSGRSIAEGIGLGLYSTKTLADALGLAVKLSAQPGKGTQFSIFLTPGASSPKARTSVP